MRNSKAKLIRKHVVKLIESHGADQKTSYIGFGGGRNVTHEIVLASKPVKLVSTCKKGLASIFKKIYHKGVSCQQLSKI